MAVALRESGVPINRKREHRQDSRHAGEGQYWPRTAQRAFMEAAVWKRDAESDEFAVRPIGRRRRLQVGEPPFHADSERPR